VAKIKIIDVPTPKSQSFHSGHEKPSGENKNVFMNMLEREAQKQNWFPRY
jgi:hypothetical protein